jgi:hypothetical protein
VRKPIALLSAALLAAFIVAGVRFAHAGRQQAAKACPSGYVTQGEAEAAAQRAGAGEAGELSGGSLDSVCVSVKHPEKLWELIQRQEEQKTVRSAPYGSVAPGAYANAVDQHQKLAQGGPKVAGTSGAWSQYGNGPLIVNDPKYGSVNGLGLVNNEGRIDSLRYDPVHKRLFATKGTGGIWLSEDLGDHWRSVGDTLPSQVVGAVAWSEANGGTVLAVSGDPSFGGGGYTGYGAFYSTNLGKSWSKASGIPDGALGFAIEVDPSNAKTVYAATSVGLLRSIDGGKSYVNVNLPTGPCAGIQGGTTGHPECLLANVVTDVVVATPGGVSTSATAGTVVATVGWRAGPRKNSDGTVQSPNNGIYRSTTGAPGSFVKEAAPGFAQQDRIGRVELGTTVGGQQDHDYLYAIVQDAATLNGQLDVVDINGIPDPRGSSQGTNLNGIYVSADFGKTWTLMADDNAIAKNPATGSALVGYGQANGVEPGIQAWYNEWIQPDPSRQTLGGIPTRLAFGLEEVWQNELTAQPMNGPATFKVIGRYFAGQTCMFLGLGLPECPTNRPPTVSTTTHPDQQDGIWIPDGTGGVTLAVGNDGSFYRQHQTAAGEFDNGGWGDGNDTGMNTLLPYGIAAANDGTVWAGLQDNGHLKITPDGKEYETYGGDGTWAAVDPNNSDIAYEAYVYNAMKVTTDGGKSWSAIDPKVTNARFVNPFTMDPTDPKHLMTAGREVVETIYGPDTVGPFDSGANSWAKVFDLGTAQHPGDATATASASDPGMGMSAVAIKGDAAYVGACGVCDILNATAPFKNELGTNVGGAKPGQRMSSDGWHIATAAGLPNRYITSIAIDPANTQTIYVTLGGYSRRWVPPGTLQDTNQNVGVGHIFKSTDGGETFTDVSGNLPDVPATWVTLRGTQVVVATDAGVYASDPTGGTTYAVLKGLPVVPISSLTLKPNDCNTLFAATYGRSVWKYQFASSIASCVSGGGGGTPATPPPGATGTSLAGPYGWELGDEGWTTSSTSAATGWKRASPGATSSTSFQVFPYTDESTYALTSPATANPVGWVYVNFQRKQDTEPGFDYLNLEWSTDGGANWKAAPWIWDGTTQTWRDDLAFTGKNASFPAFDLEKAAFQAPAGGSLQIRFRLSSDQLVSSPLYTGAWVDDVAMTQ